MNKRAPNRVHVVRPPAQDEYVQRNNQSTEIVRMLAKISDKLKRSEAERYELLSELREYRKSLRELEDKSQNSDKAYLALETRMKTSGSLDTESVGRQLKFEKSLKHTEEKLVQAIAGQALIDQRLKDTEDQQVAINERVDQSVAEQARLNRQHELVAQDKSRLVRKVERLEELVTETQDSLRAKAMVLLTDKSNGNAAALQAPAWGTGSPAVAAPAEEQEKTIWQKIFTIQNTGMVSIVAIALLAGWSINQMQQPQLPLIENTPFYETSALEEASALESSIEESITAQPVAATTMAEPEANATDVLNYSDEQLLAALNDDPEKLASQLNEIAPAKASPEAEKVAEETQTKAKSVEAVEPKVTKEPLVKNFDQIAFKQNPTIAKQINSQKSNAPLKEQMAIDSNLPAAVKKIEAEAYKGNAEAQHDLAAIYTAGQGVEQNFERAGFWFRQSADNGIGNARYNLGVLNHQGLGIERNLDKALYWYREAAKLGHAEAQYNLGIAHIEGIGSDYNPRLAAAFFEKAANNGVMEAAYNLGLIYENGLLGDVKPDDALLWYKIAADQGSPDARAAMEQLAKNLQIDMNDVNKLVDRMQQIHKSTTGRKAGPDTTNLRSSSINNQQALIAQVQEYLMLTGIYSGPADGINGPRTAQAIRDYQGANNLTVDGKITKELLNAMVGGTLTKTN